MANESTPTQSKRRSYDMRLEMEAIGLSSKQMDRIFDDVYRFTGQIGASAFSLGLIEGTPVPLQTAGHPDYDPNKKGIVLRDNPQAPKLRQQYEYSLGFSAMTTKILNKATTYWPKGNQV
jgi:hypothetical protein